MPAARSDVRFRQLPGAAALGLGYFVAAALTVRFTRLDGGVALIWVATALLTAQLAMRPARSWAPPIAACWIGSAIATALFGLGPHAAIPMAFVNMAEAMIGAALLRRQNPAGRHFGSLGDIGRFLLAAGLIAPVATGLAGGAVAHFTAPVGYWPNVIGWIAGHSLGAITFAPIALLCLSGELREWRAGAGRRDLRDAALLLVAVAGGAICAFAQSALPLLFLPFLPMTVFVFRCGRIGAALSLIALTAIGLAFTVNHIGPLQLIADGNAFRAQFLQFYLATAALTMLPAAAELNHRKRTLATLEETSALQSLILDRTSDIIMSLGIDGTPRYVSPAFEVMLGYGVADMAGRKPHQLIHAEDMPAVAATHRRALAAPHDTFIVEYRVTRQDGTVGWFESHTRATVDEGDRPTGVVTIVREVTHRKAVEVELAREATTDGLTGIANRRAFDQALDAQIAASAQGNWPLTVAVFDLDRFKAVNDRYGHATGDAVIRAFATLLRATVREGDFVARLGGEEFAAILPRTDIEAAEGICERVRGRFADLPVFGAAGELVLATVSAGIAADDGGGATALVRAADKALYRAKAAGRNRLAVRA